MISGLYMCEARCGVWMGLRVAELFAGVGGFRLGLEEAGHRVVWSNQWEPGTRVQHASDCYSRHFGPEGHHTVDINEIRPSTVADHDLLVGGFPCQDYSRPMIARSKGIKGSKGKLWWNIEAVLREKRPPYVLLENVNLLLRSPSYRRGRDFALLLHSMKNLGYAVEWRVVNAADYGCPQRRHRLFILGVHETTTPFASYLENSGRSRILQSDGFFATEFPTVQHQVELDLPRKPDATVNRSRASLSESFEFHFRNSGYMCRGHVWTRNVAARLDPIAPLRGIVEHSVDERFWIPPELEPAWIKVKGAKSRVRETKKGFKYEWKEGAIAYPDSLDSPARTLTTAEGGRTPSRQKHVIRDLTGQLRRLTPREAERLNGFPDDWTLGMPEGWRYFCMGNALVVPLIARMGRRLSSLTTMAAPPESVAN